MILLYATSRHTAARQVLPACQPTGAHLVALLSGGRRRGPELVLRRCLCAGCRRLAGGLLVRHGLHLLIICSCCCRQRRRRRLVVVVVLLLLRRRQRQHLWADAGLTHHVAIAAFSSSCWPIVFIYTPWKPGRLLSAKARRPACSFGGCGLFAGASCAESPRLLPPCNPPVLRQQHQMSSWAAGLCMLVADDRAAPRPRGPLSMSQQGAYTSRPDAPARSARWLPTARCRCRSPGAPRQQR